MEPQTKEKPKPANYMNNNDIGLAISTLTVHLSLYHDGIGRNRYRDRVQYFKNGIPVAVLTHAEILHTLGDLDRINALVQRVESEYSAGLADKMLKSL